MAAHFQPLEEDQEADNDDAPEAGDDDDGVARAPATPPPRRELSRGAIAVYLAVTAIGFADTNLLAPNLTAIGESFGFTAKERDEKLGGELAFGYFMIGAPAALLTGYLADRLDRRGLFAAILLLGKLPCLLAFFATAYWQLLLCRTLMGITIGAVSPLTASLAGDMFPVETRTAATAVWTTCMLLGTLGGQYLSGTVGPWLGWQVPFLPVGAAGLACALVVLLLPEPTRGRYEAALKGRYEGGGGGGWQYRAPVTGRKVRELFTIPSNLLGFVQGIPGCVPWGVIISYFNDYLAQEKGLTVQEATEVMVVFGLANGVGAFVGGLLGQRVCTPLLVAHAHRPSTPHSRRLCPPQWLHHTLQPTPTSWCGMVKGVTLGLVPWGRTVRCARAVRKNGCSPPPGVR